MQCDYPYHLQCLDPPLNAVPEGEWFCPECETTPGAPVSLDGTRRKPVKKTKAAAAHDESPKPGQKRKAAAHSDSECSSCSGSSTVC